jgi:hypothetical protein
MEMMSAPGILKLMQADSADSGPAHEVGQGAAAANLAVQQQPGSKLQPCD